MNEKKFGYALVGILAALAACVGVVSVNGRRDGVPSGHLYAAVMGALTLSEFETVIAVATRAGLIETVGLLVRLTPAGVIAAKKIGGAA